MSATPSIVRKATPDDTPEIWRLFLQGHRENGAFTLSPQKVEFFMTRALHPERIAATDTGLRGQIAVIGPPGRLEAIVFVVIGSFWYSDEYHLEELLVYVDPECRRSEHAKQCIEWMKRTADNLGLKLLTGIISKDRTAAKIKLYDRYLPRIGAFYLYPMDNPELKRMNHNMDKSSWLDAKKIA